MSSSCGTSSDWHESFHSGWRPQAPSNSESESETPSQASSLSEAQKHFLSFSDSEYEPQADSESQAGGMGGSGDSLSVVTVCDPASGPLAPGNWHIANNLNFELVLSKPHRDCQ